MTNKRAPFTPAAARENGLANTTGKLRTTFKPKGKTRVAENTLSQCRKFNCICSSRLRGDLDSWKTLNVYIYSPHKNRDIVFSTVIFDVAYALVRNCRSYLVTVSGRPISYFPFLAQLRHACACGHTKYLPVAHSGACLECSAALACDYYNPAPCSSVYTVVRRWV